MEDAAFAIIVRREAPSSGKPGDKAIITKNGEVKGWIGGGCTKGIVIKESLEAIRQQTPRLVRIDPKMDAPEQEGVKNYRMTCSSGGSVDVYIEPICPATKLVIFGRSHVAKALCAIGPPAGFSLSVISDKDLFEGTEVQALKDLDRSTGLSNSYVVVCTQGEDDLVSVRTAIDAKPKHLSFVASRKKANSIFMELRREGVAHEELVKVKTPARTGHQRQNLRRSRHIDPG